MLFLEYFIAYFGFALTGFFAALIYIDINDFKGRMVLHIIIFSLVQIAVCVLLASLQFLQINFNFDYLCYSLLSIVQACYIFSSIKTSRAKCFYIILAGVMSRHAGSRVSNFVLHFIPLNIAPVVSIVKTAIIFATLIPPWLLLGERIQKDKQFKPDVKQLVALFVAATILLLSAYLEPIVSETDIFAYSYLTVMEVTFCYLVLGFQYAMFRHARNILQVEYESELMEVRLEQYENFQNVIDAVNIKYHDLKHQIRQFSGGEIIDKETLKNLEDVVTDYGTFIKTGNDNLDAILTQTNIICKSKGIEMTCMLDGKQFEFLSVEDLRALFGNALDNAVEYLSAIENIDNRFLHISTVKSDNFLKLFFENYYEGELKLDKDNMPVSSKGDKFYHGFGTKSIKLIAEKYGGAASFKANGVFCVEVIFPLEILK